MSVVLLWFVTAVYAFTAMSLFAEGKHGMALCFLGYSIANVGIIWSLQ